jgi:hypothetical protein
MKNGLYIQLDEQWGSGQLKYPHEVVDRQLAYAPRNKVDAAYDRTKFLDERKKMMQAWADYLDAIASDHKVLVGRFGKLA